MGGALVVGTPALLEARRIAGWIAAEGRVPVEIGRAGNQWGVFVPRSRLAGARAVFRRVIASNPPGAFAVMVRPAHGEPYRRVGPVYRTLWRATAAADDLARRRGAHKAVVLDARTRRVRFVAYDVRSVRNPMTDKEARPTIARNPRLRAALRNPRPSSAALGEAALQIAARGAKAYLDKHGLSAEPGALMEAVRSRVQARISEALADAKAALEAHMPQVAEQTFAATMIQAGIEAAKSTAGAGANRRGRARRNPIEERFLTAGTKLRLTSGAYGTGDVTLVDVRTTPEGYVMTLRADEDIAQMGGHVVTKGRTFLVPWRERHKLSYRGGASANRGRRNVPVEVFWSRARAAQRRALLMAVGMHPDVAWSWTATPWTRMPQKWQTALRAGWEDAAANPLDKRYRVVAKLPTERAWTPLSSFDDPDRAVVDALRKAAGRKVDVMVWDAKKGRDVWKGSGPSPKVPAWRTKPPAGLVGYETFVNRDGAFKAPGHRGNPISELERRRLLETIGVTLDGKPAKIVGAREPFGWVVSLDGKLRGEWSWDAIKRTVERGYGRFRLNPTARNPVPSKRLLPLRERTMRLGDAMRWGRKLLDAGLDVRLWDGSGWEVLIRPDDSLATPSGRAKDGGRSYLSRGAGMVRTWPITLVSPRLGPGALTPREIRRALAGAAANRLTRAEAGGLLRQSRGHFAEARRLKAVGSLAIAQYEAGLARGKVSAVAQTGTSRARAAAQRLRVRQVLLNPHAGMTGLMSRRDARRAMTYA